MFAYGKRIMNSKKSSLAAGLNLKVLYKGFQKTLYTENATNLDTSEQRGGRDPVFENGYSRTGFSTNLGLLYDLGRHHSIGLTLYDINQPDMGLADKDRVALATKLGYAYRSTNFNMTSDLTFKRRDIAISAGTEKWFMGKTLAVRGGLGIGEREYASLSLGASYRYSRLFQFDYSFVYPLRGVSSFSGSHRFSLTLRFGVKSPEEELEEKLERTESELKSAKEAAERAKLEVEELMKAKEISEEEVRKVQERQRQTEETLHRLEEELLRIKGRLQTEKVTRTKVMQRHWGKGFGYYQSGEYEKAIVEFEKILELDPKHSEAKRMIKQAKEKIEESRSKEEIEKRYTRGLKAYSEGRLQEADREWKEALKLGPDNEKIKKALEAVGKELQLMEEKR